MKAINLRHYPILAGLTQEVLARVSVCTGSASLEIETGKHPPRPRTLKKLAYALNADTRAIVGNRHLPPGDRRRVQMSAEPAENLKLRSERLSDEQDSLGDARRLRLFALAKMAAALAREGER